MALVKVQDDDESLHILATDGCYLLSERDVKAQCGHNNFQAGPGRIRDFSVVVTGEEGHSCMCVRAGNIPVVWEGRIACAR